jgi:hypothetical protein
MKILFAMNIVGKKTGVPEKVHTMISTLESMGHSVKFLPLAEVEPENERVFEKYYFTDKVTDLKKQKGFARIFMIARMVRQSDIEIVYYRLDLTLSNIIGLFLSGKKIVTEHNTIESKEIASLRKKNDPATERYYFIEKYFGFIFRQLTSGIVGVTDQILRHEQNIAITEKPGLVLTNSIDTGRYPRFKSNQKASKRIAFVGLAKLWQGIDKIYNLMGDPLMADFKLIIIGDADANELQCGRAVPENIEFCGPLFGEELITKLLSCDIAIGSLAVYRKGIQQACPIKVRLYLALGLPVMIGYDDPDLPSGVSFVFSVPNNDEKISAKEFVEFYNKVTSVAELNLSIRKFATDNLDTKVKMKELVSFFEQVLK